MTDNAAGISLAVPPEILADVDFREGFRGAADWAMIIDGLNAVGATIAIGTLIKDLPSFARSVRRWASQQRRTTVITVQPPGQPPMTFLLPPNVSEVTIVAEMRKILD